MTDGQTLNLYGTLKAGVTSSAIKKTSGSASIFINGGTVLVNQTTNEVGGDDYTFLYYSGNRITYTLGNGGVKFEVNNPGTITRVSGALSNASGAVGTVTKTGTGTLQLSASNTYTGVTTIQGGCVEILNTSATSGYTGGFSMQGGMLNSKAGYSIPVNPVSSGENVLLGNFRDSTSAGVNTPWTVQGTSTSVTLGNENKEGNLTTTGYVLVKDKATLTVANGTLKAQGVTIEQQQDSLRVQNDGKLVVTGGKVELANALRLGYGGTEGYMTLSGGEIKSEASSFIGGNGPGKAEISGGTLDIKDRLIVGWSGAPNSSLKVTGGTVKAKTGLSLGNSSNSSITLSGGTVATAYLGSFSGYNPGNVHIRIQGNNITWSNYAGTGNIGEVNVFSNTKLYLDLATDGFSKLTATKVSLSGATEVGYLGGIGKWNRTNITLLEGTDTFSAAGALSGNGLWGASKEEKGIVAFLNSAQEKTDWTRTSVGEEHCLKLANPTAMGWIEWNQEADTFAIDVALGAEESYEEFINWLNAETGYDHEASFQDGRISLGWSDINEGEAFFWDFSKFDGTATLQGIHFHGEAVPGGEIPEPGTWLLLVLGCFWLVRKRS